MKSSTAPPTAASQDDPELKLAAEFEAICTLAGIPKFVCEKLQQHLYFSEDSEGTIKLDRLLPSWWRWSTNFGNGADIPWSPDEAARLKALRPYADALLATAKARGITHLSLVISSDEEATQIAIDRSSNSRVTKHYYTDVPGIGNVAISRHAQSQAEDAGFNDEMITQALMQPDGKDIPDHQGVVFRDRALLRLVIVLRPEPFRGASLVTTIIRTKPTAVAK